MLAFWLITGLIAALAAIIVLAFAARQAAARGRAPAQEAAARQFDELDALRERGLLDEENWRIARAEAARRLLKDAAREHWGLLLELLPAGDPRRRELEQALEAAAQ